MATNEQLRRIVIRVVTSLLNLIIGPAGAWVALGIRGVAGYIVVHTVSRFIIAELASKKEELERQVRSEEELSSDLFFPFFANPVC